jgi:hypothetical protein
MRALTAEEVLSAAERLRGEPPARRGAATLAHGTGIARDEAMALPVGERDDRLLALRIATFGAELTAVADCPHCGQPCETTFDATALRIGATAPEIVEVEQGGWRIRARLPNSDDVAASLQSSDPRRALLARCIVERSRDDELPEEIVEAVEAEMERADPRGDINLALTCPRCAAAWSAPLDVPRFFWTELSAAARRLVQEVDILARTYGWPERDILQMSAARRQTYVGMCVE